MRTRFFSTLTLWLLALAPASAHFHMLFPDAHSVEKGQKVRFHYMWGHPYEHQLFDASQPTSLIVLQPDGTRKDLTSTLEKLAPDDKVKVTRYRFDFTPDQRGDYVLLAEAPPVWLAEEEEFIQDTVKVILHVQGQKGWDAAVRGDFEWLPLTRPYGLLPGMVVQAGVRSRIQINKERPAPKVQLATPAVYRPVAGSMVEIERYLAEPPTVLPPDELITRVVKTDPNGVVTTILTEPGWWCLTVTRPAGDREHEGKKYPLLQRSTIWVFVNRPPRQR